MRLSVDGREFEGRAIDLVDALSGPTDPDVHSLSRAVVGAIRGEAATTAGTADARATDPEATGAAATDPEATDARATDTVPAGTGAVDPENPRSRAGGPESTPAVAVDCADPGPIHDRIGHVTPDTDPSLRGALADAARSRGISAPESTALAAARERLDSLSPPDADPSAARRRVAEVGEDRRRLRERVATLRGRLQALREVDDADAVAEAERELSEATRELSEVETERIAAEQRLDRLERDVRAARDAREERLALQDRIGNLERAARRSLAAAVWDEFADAAAALPGDGAVGDDPGTYRGDPVTAALAAVRVADVDAPVVLSIRRFESATEAATRLNAPVVRT
jgi:hypothetical protein